MAAPAKSQPQSRWVRDLLCAETLADDLGVLGSWVGPRTGPVKRTNGQKEDYVLRRLLVAWKETRRLSFPVQVLAENMQDGEPDFLLSWPDGQTLGVEVTEAGEEDYQAWLTKTESGSSDVELIPLEASTDRTVSEIKRAIARKIAKLDKGYYSSPKECDLVVYDNTAWGGFIDKQEILSSLGRPNDLMGKFRQIHLVFGELICLDVFGRAPLFKDISATYEIDYARWIHEQVERLHQGAKEELDLAHIAEEIEDLGKSERRALASHLRNLLVHLLKWSYQPERRGNSWSASISNAKSEIQQLLMENPSFKQRVLKELLNVQYERARLAATEETGLPLEIFPEECPYTPEQLVDPEFLPNGDE